MDKKDLQTFLEEANFKQTKEFALHLVETLNKTQLNSLDSLFTVRFSFSGGNTTSDQKKSPTGHRNKPEAKSEPHHRGDDEAGTDADEDAGADEEDYDPVYKRELL